MTVVVDPGPGGLTSARAAAGVSIQELARRIGVSRPAVSQWERRGVPPARLAAVEDALAGPPDEPLAQLRALLTADPHLTEAQLKARAPHLMPLLDGAEAAGILHRRHVDAQNAAGRRYSRVLLVAGPYPHEQDAPRPLTGEEVAALRHVHGWTPEGLAHRLGVSRQRITQLERGPVPAGRQEQLRTVLVDSLPDCDLVAARTRVGLSQAEWSRRAGLTQSRLVKWERHERTVPDEAAVSLGRALAEAAADPSPAEAAAARIVKIVTAAEPTGCTRGDLTRTLSLGRAQGQTGASARDEAGLVLALRRRRVHWAETWSQRRDGDWQVATRLHLGPRPPRRAGRTSGRDLARARREAGLSQEQLAALLDTVWGTISKWERRGRRPIPPAVAAHALTVCAEAAARREQGRQEAERQAARKRQEAAEGLSRAAAASPGLTVPQLLIAAGYGKRNPFAMAVLADLEHGQRLHRRLSPNRGDRGGSHTGVHPGPLALEDPVARISGAQLHRRRTAAGLRQRDLAERLDVGQTAVGQWERAEVPAGRLAAVEAALAKIEREGGEGRPLSGPALRRTRRATGLSQSDLAARMGVSAAAVTQWERRGVPRSRITSVQAALQAG